MARPIKHTVDYFSHDADASEGRTLSILFNHFGHEGISAWWQLLERVSRANNHIISIRNNEEKEWLAAKMHFTPEKLIVILTKMAELDAIDSCLFHTGIIWVQNLVDRISEVYKNRKQELPVKPVIEGTLYNITTTKGLHNSNCEKGKNHDNLINNTNNLITTTDNPLNNQEMLQSKVKESKVNKTKEKGELNNDEDFIKIVTSYQNNIGGLNNGTADRLRDLVDEYPVEWILLALDKSNGKRSIHYPEAILENWKTNGFDGIPKEPVRKPSIYKELK